MIVTTSVIAMPVSRMVVGGGAEPSGVTRRPETRTAGTGRSAIATSVRSSPAPTVIGVAAPAVAADGKNVVGYTAMRPAGDGGGGISTRFSVISAESPTCCVRGCPSERTSLTPAQKSSLRSEESGASSHAAGSGGLRGRHEDDVGARATNCESRNMPRSSVIAPGTSSGISFHVAELRAPGDDVLDERAHRDADDRLAGFVHHRAGDDAVLPHPELDVREPLALAEGQELALAPGPALAVAPGRIAVLRGLQVVVARRAGP